VTSCVVRAYSVYLGLLHLVVLLARRVWVLLWLWLRVGGLVVEGAVEGGGGGHESGAVG